METCPKIAPPRPPVEACLLLRLALKANIFQPGGLIALIALLALNLFGVAPAVYYPDGLTPGLSSLSSLCSHISTGSSVGPSAASSVNRGRGYFLQQNCHPDRSEPGFPATRHPPTATCAAFRKRKAHESRQRHQPRREIRSSVVEGPAVLLVLTQSSLDRRFYTPVRSIPAPREAARGEAGCAQASS